MRDTGYEKLQEPVWSRMIQVELNVEYWLRMFILAYLVVCSAAEVQQ